MRVVTISERTLILYSTGACHLCEQALALIEPLLQSGDQLEEVDISASDELFERYGLTIPVLRKEPGGAELNWPFGDAELGAFLED